MAKNSTTQHTDVLLRTQNLQSNDHVKVFQSLLEKGYLTSWSIGTNHGYMVRSVSNTVVKALSPKRKANDDDESPNKRAKPS